MGWDNYLWRSRRGPRRINKAGFGTGHGELGVVSLGGTTFVPRGMMANRKGTLHIAKGLECKAHLYSVRKRDRSIDCIFFFGWGYQSSILEYIKSFLVVEAEILLRTCFEAVSKS